MGSGQTFGPMTRPSTGHNYRKILSLPLAAVPSPAPSLTMQAQALKIFNSLSRKKELFEPQSPPFVGLYLCGPTVYGHGHLGHARSAIVFDTVYRYLRLLGYKVRYVRNITDVGHLERDADSGEDKIGKLARLEQLEPMEVVQHYTLSYHQDLEKLNCLPPSIEPRASGHIIEQIAMIQQILDRGYAYISNGSVYLDVPRYAQDFPYGELSGRVIDELLNNTRELDGQEEKRSPLDFALWKKASEEHIMRWPSPWSEGFPGWHIECSAMSAKYLGQPFDIHGGGMDLIFPHHEGEIAQCKAAGHGQPVRYWMHNNMVTVGGQKMGKSLGNGISLKEMFSGDHPMLTQAYNPMTVRFFILQAHYRSTVDFSNEALQASHKGYIKLMNGLALASKLQLPASTGTVNAGIEQELQRNCQACYDAMNDDFNTAQVIAALFNILKRINTFYTNPDKMQEVSLPVLEHALHTYRLFTEDVLGLRPESFSEQETLIAALLDVYKDAKAEKNYAQVDAIRLKFKAAGIAIKDLKTGVDWAWEE